ncbi:MAG: hypothetical protein MPN21_13645 [Thermoanaerobaculia bacterium]|nr:hypothetical protein [Thermoanaerobaculia bacterium]
MPEPIRNLRLDLAAALIISLVVSTLWLRLAPVTEGAGWIGWDAYPILAAGHLSAGSDMFDVATRRLAGEYLNAGFYRPLLMLSVSLEEYTIGASPKTSLAIQVVLFGLCLAALWAWSGAWLSSWAGGTRDPRAPALVTLVLVSLHPVVFDVVPYMPRRAELLCLLFTLLTLFLDRRWLATRRRRFLVGAGVAAAMATASKETAVVLPILLVAARVSGEADLVWACRNWRRWSRPLLGYSAAVGCVMLPRFLVLDGIGGYPDLERASVASAKLMAATLVKLFLPDSGLEHRTPAWIGFFVLVAAFAGLSALALRSSRARLHRVLRPVLLSGVWLAASALLFAFVARLSPWYLIFVACGVFVSLGTLTVEAWRYVRQDGPGRLFGGLWVLGIACLCVAWWPGSPFGGSTKELRDAGTTVATCLERMATRCDQASVVGHRSVPVQACPASVSGHGRSVAVLLPRSVEAWAALHRPDCKIVSTFSRQRRQTTGE